MARGLEVQKTINMEYAQVGFESILLGQNECPYCGTELKERLTKDIIAYTDLFGSCRFVLYINSKPIAALQIMCEQGRNGLQIASNMITVKEYRRMGYMTQLWKEAKKTFPNLYPSRHVNEMSAAFLESVKAYT